MNRKSHIEFLIGKGFLAVRIGKKYYGIVPDSVNLQPVYVPVRERAYPGKNR